MGLDKETREGIQETEEEIHKRTSIGSTRFRQKNRYVAFLSKSLNETERNYKIYDKEMLVIIRELEN